MAAGESGPADAGESEPMEAGEPGPVDAGEPGPVGAGEDAGGSGVGADNALTEAGTPGPDAGTGQAGQEAAPGGSSWGPERAESGEADLSVGAGVADLREPGEAGPADASTEEPAAIADTDRAEVLAEPTAATGPRDAGEIEQAEPVGPHATADTGQKAWEDPSADVRDLPHPTDTVGPGRQAEDTQPTSTAMHVSEAGEGEPVDAEPTEIPAAGDVGDQSGAAEPPVAEPGESSSEEPFDPAFQRAALGSDFSPGVVDPSDVFSGKERAIADRLQQEGWRIDAREPDHITQGLKNPDSMVRKTPHDPGSITEFKTMNEPTNNALKRDINDASDQAGADGDVVIDGRGVGTTQSDAERAYRRALGQPGKIVSKRVHVILGDGSMVTFEKEQL